jgi:hypothetical protein
MILGTVWATADAVSALKRSQRRRHAWLDTRKWRTSLTGNEYTKTKEGFHVVVYRSEGIGAPE